MYFKAKFIICRLKDGVELFIKISRTGCFGACRFRSVANIYENTKINGFEANNNIWLRNIHKYTKEKWIELFIALAQNKSIDILILVSPFARLISFRISLKSEAIFSFL